jgi:redox-sensitive bicupin YhaK (pirin superfamily)
MVGMSNLERSPSMIVRGGRGEIPGSPAREVLAGKEVLLGGSTVVRRLLPTLGRRLVGAWCFVDHYGPDDISDAPGMQVPPHPHIGLQTVSWLLEGSVHHRDSVGSDALIAPGELGLMTAGAAISHSEYSPPVHPRTLHGAQLWVALPDSARHIAPSFEHHRELPTLTAPGMRATVLLGEFAGARSPGTIHTPLVGADLTLERDAEVAVPLEPDFEYAVLVPVGSAIVDEVTLSAGHLLYLGTGRRELNLRAGPASRLLLLGGEPFAEQLVIWWNFVGRSGAEIASAREDWMAGRAFGTVPGAPPLAAPALPSTPLLPRGRIR